MLWERGGGGRSEQNQRVVSKDHTERSEKDEADRPCWQSTDQ